MENQFQLENFKSVNSNNEDKTDRIYLESTRKNLIANDIINSVNVTEQFEIERQNTLKFRIYGGLEYFSLLNNIPINYTDLPDFFGKQFRASNVRNLINSFDIYLLKLHSEHVELGNGKYIRNYQVIATPNDLDIFNAGFSRNVFYEPKNIFTYSKSFEFYNDRDGFGKPIIDVFLYFNYRPGTNGNGIIENIKKKTFDSGSDENTFTLTDLPFTSYVIGDIISGDLVEYQKELFIETQTSSLEYYISVPYGSPNNYIVLKYEPLIRIKLREYDSQIVVQNITGNTVDVQIPNYAVDLGNGNYAWQDILEFGFTDPIEGNGVNFPFVNGSHYVHGNYVISMKPDMSDSNTSIVFNEINFGGNLLINTTPLVGLENAGLKC